MKITECGYEERLKRALLAIQFICEGSEDKTFEYIYMIAHSALGTCPHPSWLLLIEETEEAGKNNKGYFLEEELARPVV